MSLSNKLRVLIVITVAVALCTAGFIAHHVKRPTAIITQTDAATVKPSDTTVTPSAPTITIKNITIKEADPTHGYELTVTAKESMFLNNIERITCNGVRCNITKNGMQQANLVAKTAHVERTRKEVFFEGPARGVLKDLTFFTSDVLYNFATQTVTTTRTTVLKHPSFTVTAPQSNIDIHNHVITMRGGVHTEFLNSAAPDNRR
jgi:hypothetical protein